MMKSTIKHRRTGLIVQPDDLEIGHYYAVYGLKNGSEEQVQIAGMGFKLLAMNLPFLIGRLASDAAYSPVTFDTRFLTFMKVSDDYVKCQRQEQETA